MENDSFLRSLWLDRLQKEYESIQYYYRVRLTPPLLDIAPLKSRWGTWDPLARTITLSSELIQNFSWDIVLEVFKHEIAHQMASELYGSDESHGSAFKESCTRLGMAEWACRAETDFADLAAISRTSVLSGPEERLFSRVEKLLALATSSNEYEALLAMQKVQELYAKYQLDRIESKKAAQFVTRSFSFKKKRIERYQYMACSLLSDHFFVRVIFTSTYDATDCCEYKAFEILGTQESVRMAEYVYFFLQQQLASLWESYRSHPVRKKRRAKNSFYMGVLSGFRKKLEKEAQEREVPTSHRNSMSLLVIEDKQLEAYVSYRFPRLTSVKRGSHLRDSASYEAGVEAGSRLILRKGIEERQGNAGKLLR